MNKKLYSFKTIKKVLFISCIIILSGCILNKKTNSKNDYFITSDYDCHLKTIVISLSIDDKSLDKQDNLLSSLPEYTKILLLLPQENMHYINNELKSKPYRSKIELIPFKTINKEIIDYFFIIPDKKRLQYYPFEKSLSYPHGTIWVQDLFITAQKNKNGKFLLLVPEAHKWFVSFKKKPKVHELINDNSYIDLLKSDTIDIQRLDLTFNGGNILVDELDGKRIAFCGNDIIRKTKIVATSLNRKKFLTTQNIINSLKNSLNVDEVIVVGQGKRQPHLMFHLDQAMILLENRTAGITNIINRHYDNKFINNEEDIIKLNEVKDFLTKLRIILQKYNYKILDIDISIENLFNHQFYVNALPYYDAITNQKKIIMPIFEEDALDKELQEKNTKLFESSGYSVKHVKSLAFKDKGGIHCLINIIE